MTELPAPFPKGPLRPGVVFQPERERLLVFGWARIQVLRTWPDLRAFVFDPCTRSCRGFRPDFDLRSRGLDPSGGSTPARPCRRPSQAAWAAYFSPIPDAARRRAARFTERQWSVLMLERRVPGADELIDDAPALAFALANGAELGAIRDPLRRARRLVRARRRTILESLGFPGTPSAVRTLGALARPSVRTDTLRELRQILTVGCAGALDWLRHLDRVNAGAVRLLNAENARSRVTFGFLEELAHDRREDVRPQIADRLACFSRLAEILGSRSKGRSRFATLADFERSSRDLEGMIAALAENGRFPEPPVPSDERVIAIETPAGLVAEGRAMKNCLANPAHLPSYLERTLSGRSAFYRVVEPRATLQLGREGSRWRVVGLLGPRNQDPDASLLRVVAEWIRSHPRFGHPFEMVYPVDAEHIFVSADPARRLDDPDESPICPVQGDLFADPFADEVPF